MALNNIPNVSSKRNPLVLLVEDDDIVRMIHRKYLQQLNCEVIEARDWKECFYQLAAKPDLILLDIGLPEKSGFDITREIREKEKGTNKHLPIIALTGFGNIIRDITAESGCDAQINKPTTPQELKQEMDKVLK